MIETMFMHTDQKLSVSSVLTSCGTSCKRIAHVVHNPTCHKKIRNLSGKKISNLKQ